MRVAYLGNFEPDHSTENHVRQALEHNGHAVYRFQESQPKKWEHLIGQIYQVDMVLWTRTGWSPPIPQDLQHRVISTAREHGKPVVGYHLDRWFGLNREGDVRKEPFFKIDLNITADGDPRHQRKFEDLGVNHVWFPPGVSLVECQRSPREVDEYKHDVVFVGSTESYHAEWEYRLRLARWLERTFGDRIGIYPRNKPALRGQPLVDLYHNCKVVVGDSCLNGGITHYWSDRIPETLGRGGFLIHPNVEGLEDHFTPGEHLVTYNLGDFHELERLVNYYVEHDDEREAIAAAGRQHVLDNHTYEVRMVQLMDLLVDRGMLT